MSIRNKAWYTAGFQVTFYSFFGENLGEYDTGYLEGWGFRHSRDFKIPKSTYRVHVHMDIKGSKEEKDIDFYADESAVNEKSRIELTSKGALGSSRFKVKTNNGWSEKDLECPQKGFINLINACPFTDDTIEIFFSRHGHLICREVFRSSSFSNETIKIPDYTTRVSFDVYENRWGSYRWHDYFELDIKASSADVTTVSYTYYHPILSFNCPESWQRIEE